MPLYDCLLLFKPSVSTESVIHLVQRVGQHVYRRNGVLTDIKCLDKEIKLPYASREEVKFPYASRKEVKLGYGIKKLDGRYYQGKLMQMTMMTPPSFNSELHYLNKEDMLLRWLLIKHRDMKFGSSFFGDDDITSDLRSVRNNLFDNEKIELDDDDEDDDEEVDEQSET